MKLKFIKSITDIFSIKLGKIVVDDVTKECYRVPKIVSSFFSIFHYGGIGALLAVFIFLLLPNIFNSISITIIVALIIYLLFEVLMLLLLPLKKINCWEKSLQEKK